MAHPGAGSPGGQAVSYVSRTRSWRWSRDGAWERDGGDLVGSATGPGRIELMWVGRSLTFRGWHRVAGTRYTIQLGNQRTWVLEGAMGRNPHDASATA